MLLGKEKRQSLRHTWLPSRPANGESFTPKVMEMVGGSNSMVGNAVVTYQNIQNPIRYKTNSNGSNYVISQNKEVEYTFK